jgi:alpha-1,3-mannosyltransferase
MPPRPAPKPYWPTLLLGAAVAAAVPCLTSYTEIDWRAYMDEVEGPLLHNEFDYEKLKGDTGPLVYPSGFVYVFILLRFLTDGGANIPKAQAIFSLVHVGVMALALWGVYRSTSTTPSWALPLVVLSRRTHSIFSLRLFNDGVAMLFAYASLYSCTVGHWTLASVMLALGISVKMNVVLFVPGFAVLLLESCGFAGAAWRALLCLAVHVALAWPFLMANSKGYLTRSFDLGRVFMHEWTVNYKFLDQDVFQSPVLAKALLCATLLTWVGFGHFRWARKRGGLFRLLWNSLRDPAAADGRPVSMDHIVTTMLESNFIGVCFARSLHYQFYAWFSHALPFLIWRGSAFGGRAKPLGVCVWLAVELCFNVFPATPASSLLLQLCLNGMLLSLAMSPVEVPQQPQERPLEAEEEKEKKH